MLKVTFRITLTFVIILFLLTVVRINDNENIIPKFIVEKLDNIQDKMMILKEEISYDKEDEIGKLFINKIGVAEKLYTLDSNENNVDKHVTVLKESIFPDEENSIVFIAAHSGTGRLAYFKNLNKLKEEDEIILKYKDKKYYYKVKSVWEESKNGFIKVTKEEGKQLILTTCSPTNEDLQLIVNCIENKKI